MSIYNGIDFKNDKWAVYVGTTGEALALQDFLFEKGIYWDFAKDTLVFISNCWISNIDVANGTAKNCFCWLSDEAAKEYGWTKYRLDVQYKTEISVEAVSNPISEKAKLLRSQIKDLQKQLKELEG